MSTSSSSRRPLPYTRQSCLAELGLPIERAHTREEIARAYRDAVLRRHPDSGGATACAEALNRAVHARNVLVGDGGGGGHGGAGGGARGGGWYSRPDPFTTWRGSSARRFANHVKLCVVLATFATAGTLTLLPDGTLSGRVEEDGRREGRLVGSWEAHSGSVRLAWIWGGDVQALLLRLEVAEAVVSACEQRWVFRVTEGGGEVQHVGAVDVGGEHVDVMSAAGGGESFRSSFSRIEWSLLYHDEEGTRRC